MKILEKIYYGFWVVVSSIVVIAIILLVPARLQEKWDSWQDETM